MNPCDDEWDLIFLFVANPVGCWGAGPSVQRAAAEPAEQTWTADGIQTHTVIEDNGADKMQTNCTRTNDYFCTFLPPLFMVVYSKSIYI